MILSNLIPHYFPEDIPGNDNNDIAEVMIIMIVVMIFPKFCHAIKQANIFKNNTIIFNFFFFMFTNYKLLNGVLAL